MELVEGQTPQQLYRLPASSPILLAAMAKTQAQMTAACRFLTAYDSLGLPRPGPLVLHVGASGEQ